MTKNTGIKQKVSFTSFLIIALLASTILIIKIPIITQAQTPSGYYYSAEWGNQNLNKPVGIAIDNNGNFYISDGLDRIQKFSSTGTLLGSWGKTGVDDGEFNTPKGIAIDQAGNIYVADSYNHRIQKFNANGEFITKWGSRGTDLRQFTYPAGIAIDSQGNIYVADTDNDRIQKFTSNGDFITTWGSEGKGNDQLNSPPDLAVDKNGYVYIDDALNDRIQKFTSNGEFVSSWGDFSYSQGIAVDENNNVYASDYDKVSKFNSDGRFITKWGNYGSGEGQFSSPTDLAISTSGQVFVLDTSNNRVEVFSSAGTSTPPNRPWIVTFEIPTNIIIAIAISAAIVGTYFIIRKRGVRLTVLRRWHKPRWIVLIAVACSLVIVMSLYYSLIPAPVATGLLTVSMGTAALLIALMALEVNQNKQSASENKSSKEQPEERPKKS